jgi:hypothetical protein
MCGKQGDGAGYGSLDLTSYRLARRSDEMIHSEIRALYNYWDGLRAGRPCPYRAEVDPRDMTCDARHLFLLEDMGEGNPRFRLAGTALLDAFGYDLRGMSARSIMSGQARESFVALIEETMAETGIGYGRLLAPDLETVWEVLLLPLRGNFGSVDRLIGCLHPVSRRMPQAGAVPLRFTIAEMSIRPVQVGPEIDPGDTGPLPGFAEPRAEFDGARGTGLTAIDGGLKDDEGERPATASGGERPRLRVVKTDD